MGCGTSFVTSSGRRSTRPPRRRSVRSRSSSRISTTTSPSSSTRSSAAGPDDRQTEAAAAATCGVGGTAAADEAIEDLVLHPGRDPGAVVEYLEQCLVSVPPGGEFDGRLLRRVADRVLEQVPDQAVELVRVASKRQRSLQLDLESAPIRERLDLLERSRGDLG